MKSFKEIKEKAIELQPGFDRWLIEKLEGWGEFEDAMQVAMILYVTGMHATHSMLLTTREADKL